MPVTAGSNTINVLSQSLAEAITSGSPTRQTVGDKNAAFGWTTGMPRGFWTFTNVVLASGSGYTALTVSPSATPVAKVAEGGLKTNAVTIDARTLALAKYAGLAEFTMERALYSDVLPQAVTSCLVAGALVALETDCAAEALAEAGEDIAGDADWTSAILRGIGVVAGNGGNPNLLVMSPADFAKAVAGPSQLQFSGADAIPTYLGLQLHLSPAIAAGRGLVMDAAAFTVAESVESPAVVVDPFSKADTNTIRVVADVLAVPAVTSPGNVVSLTPTIPATATASTKGK